MKDEAKKDVKICPSCKVENPTSHVTCQVCHAKLNSKIPTSKSPNPFAVPTSPPEKIEQPESLKTEEMKVGARGSRKKVGVLPTESASTKVKRHRRKRSSKKNDEPIFFILKDGKLQAVNITWGVMKPIKRNELPETERNVLSVWNRNKDLFVK